MSTKCVTCEVEFIGGPLDGHVEALDYPPAPFISATASHSWRVGVWLRRLLPWIACTGTVAVYELYEADGQLRYRHTGSVASLPGSLPCIRVDVSGSTGGKSHKT